MRLFIFVFITITYSFSYAQSLKYKADIEPVLKADYDMSSLSVLELYYTQNLDKNNQPTAQALQYLKERMEKVLLHIGHTYEKFAVENKNYPTTDTAIVNIKNAVVWYKKVLDDYGIKNDTLIKHITYLQTLPQTWTNDNKATVRTIQEYKETFKSNLLRIQVYDEAKAVELAEKYKNIVLVNEYKQAKLESGDVLSDIEREKEIEEKKKAEAAIRKAEIQENLAKENNRKAFLSIQKKCENENPCPNCPLEVAIKFRDAYYNGDITAMQQLVIDYYGDKKLFYEKDINLFDELSVELKNKYSHQFKAKTADYKKTDPVNVVYYTDNEEKDFFIDNNYKSFLLHATVFQAVNEWEKVDLVKYQGKWYVYRVGGAYGGRSGNTIANGKFHLDPRFLQKEIKKKKK